MRNLALLFLALSLAACGAPLQTTPVSNARAVAMAENNAPSGANDCAVISVVAYGNRDTRVVPPMSSKSFGADCDWNGPGVTALTVAPPDPGPYYKGLRLFFRAPRYSSDGTEATIDYSVDGNAGPGNYFFVDYKCSAGKRAGRWQFVSCGVGVIT
jgi:hypothetical protein